MPRFLLLPLLIPSFLITFSFSDIVIAYDTKSQGDPKAISEVQKVEVQKILKIAQEENIKVTFKPVPWKRALLMLEKGRIDGVIQASFKKDRANYAYYPMKDGQVDSQKRLNDGNSYYIYRHINSELRWDGQQFHHTGVVAAMDKYAVIEDLQKHTNITIKLFNNNSEIIRKLASHQLDAYAGSSRITDALLKKVPAFAKSIVRESLPIRKKDYYLIFSKVTFENKKDEIKKIWNGLKRFNQQNK